MHKRISLQTIEPGDSIDNIQAKDLYTCDRCSAEIEDYTKMCVIQEIYIHWQRLPERIMLCDPCAKQVFGFVLSISRFVASS